MKKIIIISKRSWINRKFNERKNKGKIHEIKCDKPKKRVVKVPVTQYTEGNIGKINDILSRIKTDAIVLSE